MYVSIGLDLSLRETGITVLRNGKKKYTGVINSKKEGDRPLDELKRIVQIVKEIDLTIKEYAPDGKVDIVVIENLAFGVQNTTSFTQLSGLNYFIRELCLKYDWPFVLITPATLKKFVTGKGNSDKNVMLLEIYKKWGETFLNDNEADSYALAKLGDLFNSKKENNKKYTQIVSLIETQLT